MTIKEYLISRHHLFIIVGVFGGMIVLFWYLRGADIKKDTTNSCTYLAPKEDEALIVDPSRHIIQIIKKNNVKVITLPDRPVRISIMTDHSVKVVAPQYGTENRPFLVGAFALDGTKLGLGVDLLYYKRVDLGAGLLVNPVHVQDARVFIGVSYFVYSNTSLMLGIDNQKNPLIGIKVRL